MPNRFSTSQVIKTLKKNGFVLVSQKGSHIKYKKAERTVIVPEGKKEIPAGTFQSILRQSGLTVQDFLK